MARYRVSVQSPKSPVEAFVYLADFRNVAEWDPGVSSARLRNGGEPGPSAAYDVVANNIDLIYETVEYRAPSRVVLEAETGVLRSHDVITVSAVDGQGSLVSYDARLQLRGPLKLFDPILSLAFHRIGGKAAAGLEKALNGKIVG